MAFARVNTSTSLDDEKCQAEDECRLRDSPI